MIWLAIMLVSVAALAPVAMVFRGNVRNRDRSEAALALHRAQLVELERDRAEGRINPAEHAAALLEVQRRTLNAADMRDATTRPGAREPLLLAFLIVPLIAVGLYLVGGHPGMPSASSADRVAESETTEADMIDRLRTAVAAADPHSARAREGNTLLASIEEAHGDFAAAAAAWKAALVTGFDPLLAAHAAEDATRAEGHVSAESAALFRQALAQAPADAPWRPFVEKRLAEAPK
jgi:cytochrome c-type biogenesis protein CcmH